MSEKIIQTVQARNDLIVFLSIRIIRFCKNYDLLYKNVSFLNKIMNKF